MERGRVRFVRGDIANLELLEHVMAEEGTEVVVNFAAESHNSLAVLEPARFFRTNVLGTQAVCEAARRVGGWVGFGCTTSGPARCTGTCP